MPMGIVTEKAAKKLPSKIATRERLGVTRGAFYRVTGYPKWHLIRNLRMGRSLKSWLSRWTIRGETRGSQTLKAFHIICYLATGDELIFITPGR